MNDNEIMTGKQQYRVRAFALPLGVVSYIFVALIPPPAGSLEIFPFFKWSLFSDTNKVRSDVVAFVHSVDGQPLERSASFYHLKERFSFARSKDTRFAKTLDRLAYAIASDNSQLEESARTLVEDYFMAEATSVEYDLAIIRYDPIERYHTGEIMSLEVLRSYEKGV